MRGFDARQPQTSSKASKRTNVEDLFFRPVAENRMLSAADIEKQILNFKNIEMKKKIEDYLHLYLGCKIKSKGGKFGDLVSVSNDGMSIVVYDKDKINDPRGLCINSDWLLLVLRPLSDMTEDEEKYVGLELKAGTANASMLKSGYFHSMTPKVFYYLLSKHFDLFGLIESGLAVNAAELKSVGSR